MQSSTSAGAPPLGRRILDTFVAPRRLAEALRRATPWAGPLLISTAVAVLAAAALPAEFFLSRVEEPVNRLGRPVEVTSSPEVIVRWGRYLQMFSAAVEHPVVILTVAGVLTLLFSVVGGGRVEFFRYFSLASHAFLISALGLLLTVGWHLLSGDTDFHPSLAFLAGGAGAASGSSVGEVLGILNPFTIWTLVVMAVGVDGLDERHSFPAAAVILLGLYLLLAVAVAALT